MPRKSENLRKITIDIFEEDAERLERYFGGRGKIPKSKAIRIMIRRALNSLDAQAASIKAPSLADTVIDLSSIEKDARDEQ